MKRHRPIVAFIFYFLLVLPAAGQQGGIRWLADIETARAQAQQTGRLVLIHFWKSDCPPCLALEQNVFLQPGVAGALETQFVPVKINADENPATAVTFGITRLPTDVVMTPDGQLVGRHISPQTPAGYVAELSRLAAQHATQSGQAFANAAGQAPAPSGLNAANVHVQGAPGAPVMGATQLGGVANDRYAMAVPAGGAPAFGVPPMSAAPSNPGPQNGLVGNAVSVPPGVSVTPGAVFGAPGSQPVPGSTQSPYAFGAPQNVALQTTSAPTQTVNPYAGATGVAPASAPISPAVAPMAPVQSAAAVASVPPQPGMPGGPALPPGAPPLGFDGYCPVSMREQWQWLPGDARWSYVHRGRTYLFAGQKQHQTFVTDPDRYSPALAGMDPVMAIDHQQQVPGKREHSIDYDNMFYFFASEATLQQFAANPVRYSATVRQVMGIPRGRFVR